MAHKGWPNGICTKTKKRVSRLSEKLNVLASWLKSRTVQSPKRVCYRQNSNCPISKGEGIRRWQSKVQYGALWAAVSESDFIKETISNYTKVRGYTLFSEREHLLVNSEGYYHEV